jgi:hypothetical protein
VKYFFHRTNGSLLVILDIVGPAFSHLTQGRFSAMRTEKVPAAQRGKSVFSGSACLLRARCGEQMFYARWGSLFICAATQG